jgi:hypothetical protein
MTDEVSLVALRRKFHAALLGSALTISNDDVASISDKSSRVSRVIGKSIVEAIGSVLPSAKQKGQSSGVEFEDAVAGFLSDSLTLVRHLGAGKLQVQRGHLISAFQQFRHLAEIDRLVRNNEELKSALGADYLVKPDVLLFRSPEPDEELNRHADLTGFGMAEHTSLREENNPDPILKAVISCKWTLRSDRAQNARTEALNLIKNRKGSVPHIVVVTAEPMPSRLASLAFGTGEIDMVYHFALTELTAAVNALQDESSADILRMMIQGNRLRDISDLPLDLSI